MLKPSNISSISVRKLAISSLLIILTVFAFASIGGGKNKSRVKSLTVDFTPIRTNGGFTLKSKLNYRGSMLLKEERTPNSISFNSLVTYQKGNSTYILPNKYKLSIGTGSNTKSNLQLLNLRIKLCK